MTPDGEFRERHERLDDYRLYQLVSFEAKQPVPAQPGPDGRVSGAERRRARLNRWFYEDRVEPVTRAELAEARTHDHRPVPDALTGTGSHASIGH